MQPSVVSGLSTNGSADARAMPTESMTMYLPDGRGGVLRPLDLAFEYIRANTVSVLSQYLVGMAPFCAAMLVVADAVAARYVAIVPGACVVLPLATFWRCCFGTYRPISAARRLCRSGHGLRP